MLENITTHGRHVRVNGVTNKERNKISVKDSEAKTGTGPHEVGHTLGIGHWSKGLMFWKSNNRVNRISKGLVKTILNNGGVGSSNPPIITSDFENEDPQYRGKISGPVGSKDNTIGNKPAPDNFNEGKVKNK